MKLKNTANEYGLVAKWLHWSTAILFLGAYVSVYYRHWFTEEKTSANWTALQLHLSFGFLIAVIVAIRVMWRMSDQIPKQEPGTKIEHFLAHMGHFMLYVVMIMMPLTGYMGTSVNTEFFFIADITKFEDTSLFSFMVESGLVASFSAFEEPIDYIHKNILGAWFVWLLILGHVLAAFYHHLVKQDKTLEKMMLIKL